MDAGLPSCQHRLVETLKYRKPLTKGSFTSAKTQMAATGRRVRLPNRDRETHSPLKRSNMHDKPWALDIPLDSS